jgi:hypothetical protein
VSSNVYAAVLRALAHGAQRQNVWLLSDGLRGPMERLFGAALHDVQLHLDSLPAAIGARAFACGNAIFIDDRQVDLECADGWRVLGHELTHVLQQRSGRLASETGKTPSIVSDAAFELEAEQMGDRAALLYEPGCIPDRATSVSARALPFGAAIQCLMSVDEFKTASKAPGLRDKIKAVDQELTRFHALNGANPRDYGALLTQLKTLYQACNTYNAARPKSGRKAGVDALSREIALEEVVLTSLAKFYAATDDLKKWEALEETQELYQQVRYKPQFNRAGFMGELDQLMSTHINSMRNSGAASDVIRADIEELKRIAKMETAPDIVKAVILEVTAAANVQQLDLCEFTPGAKYNTTRGKIQKYTLNHMLNQGYGKKFRMGSLLHELTHVSIAETFGNTVIMLAIAPEATDDDIMDLARIRKSHILGLQSLIDKDNQLSDLLKNEMKDKAKYPLSGKFGTYLSNFKSKLAPAEYTRLTALCMRGLDCELIEYDTVINQMMLWCYLYNIADANPVYRQLRTLAQLAHDYRARHRQTRRRIVSPAGHATQTRTPGRRMSFG